MINKIKAEIEAIKMLDKEPYCDVCLTCMNVQKDTYECWKKVHYTTSSHWEESSDLESILWILENKLIKWAEETEKEIKLELAKAKEDYWLNIVNKAFHGDEK